MDREPRHNPTAVPVVRPMPIKMLNAGTAQRTTLRAACCDRLPEQIRAHARRLSRVCLPTGIASSEKKPGSSAWRCRALGGSGSGPVTQVPGQSRRGHGPTAQSDCALDRLRWRLRAGVPDQKRRPRDVSRSLVPTGAADNNDGGRQCGYRGVTGSAGVSLVRGCHH